MIDVKNASNNGMNCLNGSYPLTLPDKCREVFQYSRHENLSNREIAEKMQISIKTVEAQITKALKLIKNFLDEKYIYLF